MLEYEQRFNSLIRYAPQYEGQEELRTKRFIRGLRPELRQILRAIGARDYYTVMQSALALEQEFQEQFKSGPGSGSRTKKGQISKKAERREGCRGKQKGKQEGQRTTVTAVWSSV